VEEMAIAKWRQRRYWGTEAATLDLQMDKQAKEITEQFDKTDEMTRLAIAFQTLSDNSNALRLLDRYLAGIRRDYDRAFQRLLDLRILNSPQPSGRRKRDFTEQTEPIPLTQNHNAGYTVRSNLDWRERYDNLPSGTEVCVGRAYFWSRSDWPCC
jgi:hypothetical protein